MCNIRWALLALCCVFLAACSVADPTTVEIESQKEDLNFNDDNSCDDGFYCTTGDVSDAAGECRGTRRRCEEGFLCDEERDTCAALNEGAPCNPDNPCLQGGNFDVNGECVPGEPVECQEGFVCDQDTGACIAAQVGQACDDGVFCTVATVIQPDGSCAGGADRGCNEDFRCDNVAEACVSLNEGNACDDGVFCTINTTIQQDGSCGGGEPLQCNAGEECSEPDGRCVSLNRGNPCDDGAFCTVLDVVDIDGNCVGQPRPCDAGEVCSEENDRCQPLNLGDACDDGVFCTINTTIQQDGSCGGGQPTQCDAGEVCSEENDRCQPGNLGEVCDDGLFCTINTTVQLDGSCGDGQPFQCNAGEVCSEERTRCEDEDFGDACDDGVFCTINTTIQQDGSCGGGDPTCGAGELCSEEQNRCDIVCVVDADCAASEPVDLAANLLWGCRNDINRGQQAPFICGACEDPDGDGQCNAGPELICNDGVDGDGDNAIDCADPDCAPSPACGGNGCDLHEDCAEGQICQAHQCVGGDPEPAECGGALPACPAGEVCNAQQQCIPDPDLCENGGDQCPAGEVCQGGGVCGEPVQQACDPACPDGQICLGEDVCIEVGNGQLNRPSRYRLGFRAALNSRFDVYDAAGNDTTPPGSVINEDPEITAIGTATVVIFGVGPNDPCECLHDERAQQELGLPPTTACGVRDAQFLIRSCIWNGDHLFELAQ